MLEKGKDITRLVRSYRSKKRRPNRPKVRVHRNGSVEITVTDLLNSRAGRESLMAAHNSPSTQEWLRNHGFNPEIIDLNKDS